MACQHGADHHHARTEAHAFGNVAVLADAAIGNDGFGRHAGTPLQGAELPATSAETGFEFGDADLARADADLGGIRAPVFQIDDRLRRTHVAGDHKGPGQVFFDVADHRVHAVGVAVGDINGDEFRAQAFATHAADGLMVGFFDAHRDRGIQALRCHIAHKLQVVQVKAVHDVEVAVAREPGADLRVDHSFHIGRHDRQAECVFA